MRFLAVLLAIVVAGSPAFAECDAGPVETAARDALRTGDFTVVAIWVKPSQERSLQLAFRRALAVRKLGPDAQEVADAYFVEISARLHRDGHDSHRRAVPTTAEIALASEQPERFVELVLATVRDQLRARWDRVAVRRAYRRGDVEAGRRYVAAYVDAVHYAIDIYTAASVAPSRIEEPIRHED